VETLSRFRPSITLPASLNEIDGDNDFTTIGEVPVDWHQNRVLGTAKAEGTYADICGGEWISLLRRKLASDCVRLGVEDLDARVLQSGSPRLITQLASRVVYEVGFAGIYYRSRYGHGFENWACFEPFRIRDTDSQAIAKDHAVLLAAAKILELKAVS